MSFDENPADDRYQLDQCIDEIKSLQSQIATLTAERDEALGGVKTLTETVNSLNGQNDRLRQELAALKSCPAMAEVDALVAKWNEPGPWEPEVVSEALREYETLTRRSISSREEVVGLLKWLDEFWDFREVKKCLSEYASDKVYGDDQQKARRILEIVEGK